MSVAVSQGLTAVLQLQTPHTMGRSLPNPQRKLSVIRHADTASEWSEPRSQALPH